MQDVAFSLCYVLLFLWTTVAFTSLVRGETVACTFRYLISYSPSRALNLSIPLPSCIFNPAAQFSFRVKKVSVSSQLARERADGTFEFAISLCWDAIERADSYEVEYIGIDASSPVVHASNACNLSLPLVGSGPVTIRVRACKGAIKFPYSECLRIRFSLPHIICVARYFRFDSELELVEFLNTSVSSIAAVDDVALPARFWHQFRDRCLEHVDGELRKAALLALKNSLSKKCFRLQVSTYLAASLSHVKVPSVPDQTADQCFELVCDILCTLFADSDARESLLDESAHLLFTELKNRSSLETRVRCAQTLANLYNSYGLDLKKPTEVLSTLCVLASCEEPQLQVAIRGDQRLVDKINADVNKLLLGSSAT